MPAQPPINFRLMLAVFCTAAVSSLSSAEVAGSEVAAAARRNDLATVRRLLQQRADVNAPQNDGSTALLWAVHHGNSALATVLVRSGASPNASNDLGVFPLHEACLNRDASMVALLLQAGANASSAMPSGETALMTAAHTGDATLVKMLLRQGANVNAVESRRGQTALMWAVAENHLDAARELIESGARVTARSKTGFTPLLFAAQQGNSELTRVLLTAGADVNDATAEDGNALVVSTLSGHEELSLFLLERGANPNTADRSGATALHYAILKGLALAGGVQWDANAPYLYRPNMPRLVKALLAKGADPNARLLKRPGLPLVRGLVVVSVEGATPYLLAAASYDVDLMKVLVASGADPKATTKEGTSALIFAAGLAEGLGKPPKRTDADDEMALATVKLAEQLGNDVNAANKHDVTALHGAAYVGSDAIVRFLVDKGAKLNVKDDSGQTPLSIAQQIFPATLLDDNLRPAAIHESTAHLLLTYGADPSLVVADQ